MTTCFSAAPGIDVITTTAVIPALGSLAINAFVLHGSEPILVDTGTIADSADFVTALGSVIDPAALRWIWLTHTDFDHIGSLPALLAANPRIRVLTSFLGVGRSCAAAISRRLRGPCSPYSSERWQQLLTPNASSDPIRRRSRRC